MAREFSVVVGINATKAKVGARQFKAGADTVNRANRGMVASTGRSTKKVTALITTLGRLRGVATLAFAGFLGVGGIASVIRTISQFDTAMSKVNALLGERGTTQIMRVLTERARELGATTAFTATQAAEGMAFLTQAGFNALEVFEAIGPALTLAQAGSLGLGQAADIVSNIMAAFAIRAGDVVSVVDALAFTASRTNTNIQQLGEAMKFVAPVAGALGVRVEEVAIALGILGNAGLQASLAGTSLRRVMSGLLNPSKEATKVLAQMGLTSLELSDLLGTEGGLVNIITKLTEAGLDAAQAFVLFGQRGAPGVLALSEQLEQFTQLTDEIKDIDGVAQAMAETMIDNLGGDARIAISALQESIIQLGKSGLTDFLRETTQSFAGFFRGLSGITAGLEGMSESMQSGVKIGTLLRNNLDKLRTAMLILSTVLFRRLIFALGTYAVSMLLAIARTATLIPLLFQTGGAALLAGTAMTVLGRAVALLAGPVGLALLVGSLIAYFVAGQDSEEISNRNAAALEGMTTAASDAALTFDNVAEAQKRFKREVVSDAILAQRNALVLLQTEARGVTTAQEALGAAQEAAAASMKAFTDASESGIKGNLGLRTAAMNAADEVDRLQAIINSVDGTKLEAEISAAAASLLELIQTASGMDEVLAGNQKFLDEVAEAAERARVRLAGLEKEFKDIVGKSQEWIATLKDSVEKLLAQEKALEASKSALKDIREALLLNNTALTKAGLSREALTRAEKEAAFQVRKLTQAMTPLAKATDDQNKKNLILLAGTDKVQIANINHAFAVRDLVLANIALGKSTAEIIPIIEGVEEAHRKNIETLESACTKTRELKKCQSDESKAMQVIWDQAAKNIQDAFADAFKGAFDSFTDFRDKLVDAVKTMVAELLSAKFLGGLKNALSNLFGGGGISVTGSGSGGGGGAGTPSGGVFSGLSAGFGKFLEGAKLFALGAERLFSGASGQAIFQTGGAIQGAGALAAGAVVGLGSGLVVDQLLGGRGDPGTTKTLSAIGGTIGAFFGGVIGSLIGGGIGSLVSNIIGGAKKLESATVEFNATSAGFNAVIESVVSKQKSFFRGRKFTTTRKDVDTTQFDEALAGVINALTVTAEALGVDAVSALADFDFSRTIDIRGKSEEEIARLVEGLFQDVVLGIIGEFVDNAEGLSDRLRVTVNSFRGNADEFLRAFELAASIDLAFLIDPVKLVTDALAEENRTLTTSYQELLVAYREVISEFDGSLGSLEELAAATGIVVNAQLALTAALMQAGQEITALFQDSAQSIRESLLNEEELFNLRKTQIDALVEQVGTTTDPAELTALAQEINRLGLDAFAILDATQQGALGAEFIEFFEGLDDIFGEQVQTGLADITEDNNALNEEVATAMVSAAEAQAQAAADMQAAAASLLEASILLRQGGSRFNELQV